MGRHDPGMLFASEASAARLLDMRPAEFRALVQSGALPQPVKIAGKIERWSVAELDAIVRGHKPSGDEGLSL